MRVKRFVAPEVQEAMNKVKMELGEDAVILQVRQVKEGGFLGFFARNMVEVVAALEDKKPSSTAAGSVITERANQETASSSEATIQASLPPNIPLNLSAKQQPQETETSELQELRKVIEQMSEQLEDLGSKAKPDGAGKLQKLLLANEIEEKLAKRIVKKVKDKQGDCTMAEQQAGVAEELIKLIRNVRPLELADKRPLVAALVGPTGVGKTTTIAKLAAHFSIVKNLKVALVTGDTYRVAAVDQLKTYAEIIRVPVEVAVNHNAVHAAIQRHQDKDLILVDTAGRSPNNQIQLSELRTFLEKAQPDRVFLTISATTRARDMLEIVDKFDLPCIDSLIFTKLDETSVLGGVISVVTKTKKPLSYLTNGQNVPDDIFLANPQQLVEKILGGGTM